MLTVSPGTRVYLATEPVDMRRGHDGLCSLVHNALQLDPFSGAVFVFVGKRGDRVKCLFWDRGGFALYYKRLSRGKFKMPRVTPDADRVILDGTELAMLLGGFELASARRVAAWQPKSHQASAA